VASTIRLFSWGEIILLILDILWDEVVTIVEVESPVEEEDDGEVDEDDEDDDDEMEDRELDVEVKEEVDEAVLVVENTVQSVAFTTHLGLEAPQKLCPTWHPVIIAVSISTHVFCEGYTDTYCQQWLKRIQLSSKMFRQIKIP
jgi:hypothetical protein